MNKRALSNLHNKITHDRHYLSSTQSSRFKIKDFYSPMISINNSEFEDTFAEKNKAKTNFKVRKIIKEYNGNNRISRINEFELNCKVAKFCDDTEIIENGLEKGYNDPYIGYIDPDIAEYERKQNSDRNC